MRLNTCDTYLDWILRDKSSIDKNLALAPKARQRERFSLSCAISSRRGGDLAIIAEVKKRSPSVGVICDLARPEEKARAYVEAGAAAVSVLTQTEHFGGSIEDLAVVGNHICVPLICKDFILSDKQVFMADRAGADAVLLIAALHDERSLQRLIEAAHSVGMEVLLEVHTKGQLEQALASNADVLAINNRNLRTFKVSLSITETLAPIAKSDTRPLVAASGIHSQEDAVNMGRAGVDALLVGEALMRCRDPHLKIHELSNSGRRIGRRKKAGLS